SRDLHTSPRVVRDADKTWVAPSAAAPLGAVQRALCDRDFKRPLIGGSFRTASAKPAKAPAKAPEPADAPAATAAEIAQPKATTPKAAPPKAAPPAPTLRAQAATGPTGLAVQVGASPSLPDAKGLMLKVVKKHAGELG